MKQTRVAIVGAGGQIGPHLLRHLPETDGIEAVGICRNDITAGPLRYRGLNVRCGSLSLNARELIGDCDVVVNCASASATPGVARKEDRAVLDALFSTDSDAAIIHVSSVAVYGSSIVRGRSTFERPNADSDYAASKLFLERYARKRALESKHALTIVRLGHVYGAEQWLSRYILDNSHREGWGLAADGASLSNAIHVRNVAAALRRLILRPEPGSTFNLFDYPQSTWRQVSNWNTEAAEMPQARNLDRDRSDLESRYYRDIATAGLPLRIAREVSRWTRSAPASLLVACPSLKVVAARVLARMQSESLDRRALKFMGGTRSWTPGMAPMLTGFMVSDEAPGIALDFNPERSFKDAEAVRVWYKSYSQPG
ncbi:MAG: NAD-dependent epimerase/dehydratase family protein [Burkholderiales bacterium]